jgi:hypothetical protein
MTRVENWIMRRLLACRGAAALAFMFAFGAVEPAQACGGFFCDSPGGGQPPMPVDQTGETIVFAFDGENVEAHIQIQYAGDPERFAWLIPLQTTPEITVGSAQLFLNLLNSTVPRVSLTQSFEACFSPSSESTGLGCASSINQDSAPAAGFSGDRAGGSSGGGVVPPLIQLRKSVGAFEVNILSGSSAAVEQWLVANNFLPDDEAPRIVDEYASRGYVFAAIKLSAGAGLDELHPLVVRYRGTEPCVPLKLTAIAAKEDMAVRAFFLGQQRAVPIGDYRHVTLNLARLDWFNQDSKYTALVTNAVDSAGADGHAFVTEFAGPSAIVPSGLRAPQWNAGAFTTRRAVDVVGELQRQALLNCASVAACDSPHPQVIPLLRNHLPAPSGIPESEFWSNMSRYLDRFDPDAFDGAAFASDFEARIIEPAEHGDELLAKSSYVTRLFTTISPHEMTADPAFAELPQNHGLGDVSPGMTATDRTTCNAKPVLTLPDGREAAHDSATPPAFGNAMPWAERVDEFTAEGARIPIVDNGAAIDRELLTWNSSQGYDPGSFDRQNLAQSNDGACACQMRSSSSHGLAFALLGLLGALRRASRRASARR